MKLATLKTDWGPRVVGVALDGRFVDLCEVDVKLPTTMREILSAPEGLIAAAHALAVGMVRDRSSRADWRPRLETLAKSSVSA